jgi:hypothetical protein
MLKLILTCLFLLAALQSAYAGPRDLKNAQNAVSKIKQEERKLAASIKKLSDLERARLKRSTRGLDSDGDGLADILEPSVGGNRCDADSDDDGVDDDEDSDEDKSDSDDDGVPDGMEVETKGRIKSFNDPELVVGTTTLKITSSTVFFRGLSSKSDLLAGVCVEAEGRRVGSDILVNKIKKHTGAECGSMP